MKKGTQILYVPSHAEGDMFHPDVEYGFIMSPRPYAAFCRFWMSSGSDILRTTSTSELVMAKNIIIQTPPFTHGQGLVDKTIKAIEEEGS